MGHQDHVDSGAIGPSSHASPADKQSLLSILTAPPDLFPVRKENFIQFRINSQLVLIRPDHPLKVKV